MIESYHRYRRRLYVAYGEGYGKERCVSHLMDMVTVYCNNKDGFDKYWEKFD